jgi:hypothetical protein
LIRFFDGYATERIEELDERKLKTPLVKSFMLEIQDGEQTRISQNLERILSRRNVHLKTVDETLSLVTDGQEGEIGFLERLSYRMLVLYSIRKSNDIKPWVRSLVHSSPNIDHVWLSGLTFSVLWDLVVKLSRPNRFTRLAFTHESIFDIDGNPPEIEDDDEEESSVSSFPSEDDSQGEIIERRATSFRLVDRVGKVQKQLGALQKTYLPFCAISQLRFPSPVGRGGHDFYDDGQVTNRSESFRDHRSHILFVNRIYEQLLRSTEQQAWYSIREQVGVPGQFRKIVGAPVVIQFKEPLGPKVFDRWVQSTFERKINKFRLWGHPIRLGPTKVHVYGIDRHLWQPLFLELTAKGCIAIIPNGTCGNTVHRLVTNIQRYLDPGADAFIGDKPYKQVVEESTRGIIYDLEPE